jgi:hypothetical protein
MPTRTLAGCSRRRTSRFGSWLACGLIAAAGVGSAAPSVNPGGLTTSPNVLRPGGTAVLPVDLDGSYTVTNAACGKGGDPEPSWSITGFEGASPDFDFNGIANVTIAGTSGTEGIAEYADGTAIFNGSEYLSVSASPSQVSLSDTNTCAINTSPASLSDLSTISGTETWGGKPSGPGVELDFDQTQDIWASLTTSGTYTFWVPTPPVSWAVAAIPQPPGQGQFTVSACSPGSISGDTCNLTLLPKNPPNNGTVDFVLPMPKLSLHAPNPTTEKPTGTTPLSLKAKIIAQSSVENGSLDVRLSPKLVVPKTKSLTADVGSLAAGTTKKIGVSGGHLAPTVVADGHTIAGMNAWAKANRTWHNPALPSPTFGGGRLVYSDYPEYVDDSTQIGKGGRTPGKAVEGILYSEHGTTAAADPSNQDFRVYFNHENRTGVAKAVCLVFSAGKSGESVTPERIGIANSGGDPVATGKEALMAYLTSSPGTTIPISTKVGKKTQPVRAVCPQGASLGTHNGSVASGIVDYTAAGPATVQVGMVVVNSGDEGAFKRDPLGYSFKPAGSHPYTYASHKQLYNAHEQRGHVDGTFPHNQISMSVEPCTPTCLPYDANGGKAWGGLILGNPKKDVNDGGVPEDRPQYERATDTGKLDYGGYGMLYDLTVPVDGKKGESAQVILNDRGLGHQSRVNGAYQGVVQVNGTTIETPLAGQPGTGHSGNLTNPDYGIGIGQVKPGGAFDLQMIPPAGSTFPLGIVLAPAYVRLKGILTFHNGLKVASDPDPTYVSLAPG